MMNIQEELKKFKKLSGILKEDFESYIDDNNDDESADMKRDEHSKKMFFDCLLKIKEMNGHDFERDQYKTWVDSYFLSQYGEDNLGSM